MRVLPFLFLLCAFSLRPARAQVAAKEAPSTPIRYSRDVPQSVLKLMPRGAKSLFWGKFSPKGSGLMAIHLFDLAPQKKLPDDSSNVWIYRETLDVFKLKDKRWMRINSIQEESEGVQLTSNSSHEEGFIQANFYWIDEAKQTIPLLVFYRFIKWDYGPLGTLSLISFPDGWTKKAVKQSIGKGDSNSGGQDTWMYQDERGQTFLAYQDSWFYTLDKHKEKHFITWAFRWNGQKFVFSPEPGQKAAGGRHPDLVDGQG